MKCFPTDGSLPSSRLLEVLSNNSVTHFPFYLQCLGPGIQKTQDFHSHDCNTSMFQYSTFIVCKFSPTTVNSFSKTILATFKINRPGFKLRHFGRYPESVEGYHHDKELHSYLLIDHWYLGIRFCQRFPQSVHMRPVFEGTQDNLTTELCKVAIKYWN